MAIAKTSEQLRSPCDWCYPCPTCRDLASTVADELDAKEAEIDRLRAELDAELSAERAKRSPSEAAKEFSEKVGGER